MSSSSDRASPSPDRAQVEPLAALAAVFAVGVGLSLYAGALDGALAALDDDREMAPTAADAFVAEASSFGVVDPPLSTAAEAARPTGYRLNATLSVGEHRWQAGPPRPRTADCVERRVSARTAPGTVRPGRLEVCVWPAA
ncbi:DUF7285 family protein [Natronomonas amylolytica]|uniref:DUF7285 family protein n=1 Tax=Natronomonas amylolytica TaxID=3108498 RepID=UPI00300984B6